MWKVRAGIGNDASVSEGKGGALRRPSVQVDQVRPSKLSSTRASATFDSAADARSAR
jgi:hypothetical protein